MILGPIGWVFFFLFSFLIAIAHNIIRDNSGRQWMYRVFVYFFFPQSIFPPLFVSVAQWDSIARDIIGDDTGRQWMHRVLNSSKMDEHAKVNVAYIYFFPPTVAIFGDLFSEIRRRWTNMQRQTFSKGSALLKTLLKMSRELIFENNLYYDNTSKRSTRLNLWFEMTRGLTSENFVR